MASVNHQGEVEIEGTARVACRLARELRRAVSGRAELQPASSKFDSVKFD